MEDEVPYREGGNFLNLQLDQGWGEAQLFGSGYSSFALQVSAYWLTREAARFAVSRTMLISAVDSGWPLLLRHSIEMLPPEGRFATDVNERVPVEMLVPLKKGWSVSTPKSKPPPDSMVQIIGALDAPLRLWTSA